MDTIEYERRLSAQADRIAELAAENAELRRANAMLAEILRKAAIAVAREGLLEKLP